MTNTLVLLTPMRGPQLERLKSIFTGKAKILIAATDAELRSIDLDQTTTLLSFGSGIIVPKTFLEQLIKPAYNLHAASPEFPGRDPHHHAVYNGTHHYGATLHKMAEKVDAGDIVAVKTFPVELDETPLDLLDKANQAGMAILKEVGPRLLDIKPLPSLSGVTWGPKKTSRADLRQLSEVTPLIDEDEFALRYRAFDGGTHNNLVLRLHDKTFRIDKEHPLPNFDNGHFDEFTETAFREIIRQLKEEGYHFSKFDERPKSSHVLWRHDVDFSMHRAAKLAAIESEEGVIATYFVNPHCTFYNLLEPEVAALLQQIGDFGHDIGLHFDTGAYAVGQWSQPKLEEALSHEKRLLESISKRSVRAVSWHNPDLSNLLDIEAEEICGLTNAYSARLKRDYAYCSDSNGYWRFEPMPEVIKQGHERLHLLTHPAWWTPEPLSPSERINRAILGRARKIRRDYDNTLKQSKRLNLEK